MDIGGDDMFSSWNVLEVRIQVKNGSLKIGKSEYFDSYVISCGGIIIQDPDIIINRGNNSTLAFNDNMTVAIDCQKGNLVDISAALSSIIYFGDQNFNSVDGGIGGILIIAKGKFGSVTKISLAVYVKPMDDAP
eukprot:14028434-Ditylum_brightwellii.AAC.1